MTRIKSIIFLLGALIGLFYIFAIPPWQHYDEPSHFEYAWLIANQPKLIESGVYVQSLRREIAASMIEHNFFKHSGSPPNLLSQTTPIWIGISQTNDKPFYHWLAALPLRLLTYTDVDTQLYSSRLVSLILLLVTLGAAMGTAAEITSQKSHLRWGLPLTLILIPGFVDLMTTVNNDVGATAFYSLFIWTGTRIIKKGLSFQRLIVLIALAVTGYLTKNTVSITLVLIIIPITFGLLVNTRPRAAWYVLTAIAILGFLSIFSWGDAAHWARDNSFQSANTQMNVGDAPDGTHAFKITKSDGEPNHRIYQFLPYQVVQSLQGKEVTLGAWIWADHPMSIRSPILGYDEKSRSIAVDINNEKRFHAFSMMIPDDALRLNVSLTSISQDSGISGTIFYDGIILAEGNYDTTQTPVPDTANLSSGTWGGKPFKNLLTNASAEQSGPRIRTWAEKIITKNYPGSPALMLTVILDWKQASWYYISVFRDLFQSFWAKFSWGQVRLLGRYTYWILLVITIVGLAGSVIRLFRKPRQIPWAILFFLFISIASIWGPTVMRGINSLYSKVFIPTARYAYPAMIPIMLLLTVGWQEASQIAHKKLKIPSSIIIAFWILFWVGLNVLAIVTIYNYFYS